MLSSYVSSVSVFLFKLNNDILILYLNVTQSIFREIIRINSSLIPCLRIEVFLKLVILESSTMAGIYFISRTTARTQANTR